MSEAEVKDRNLKNQTAFTYQKTLLGIPDKVFVITALLAGFGCVLIFKLTPYYLLSGYTAVYRFLIDAISTACCHSSTRSSCVATLDSDAMVAQSLFYSIHLIFKTKNYHS